MGGIGYWQQLALAGGTIAMVALAVKLYATGLTKAYRWFSLYLLFGVFTSILLMTIGQGTNLYAMAWVCCKPLAWMLSLAVILELYSLVLARFPGIASLMRWAVATAAILSLVLSILALSLDFHNPSEKFPLLRCAFAVQRMITATMAMSLLIPLLFIARLPIVLSRNVVLHCLLFFTRMATEATALFARNLLGPEYTGMANLAMTGVSDLCLVVWIIFLTRKGEFPAQATTLKYSAEMEQQLLDRLRSFNDALTRSGMSLGRAS